jgi:signal transduction histidine kinase
MPAPTELRYPLQSQLRILVLEDSAAGYARLVAELGAQGLNVQCAHAADLDALAEALCTPGWDAIVCALRASGFALTEALQVVASTGEHPAFVVVSDIEGEETAVAAMRAGADDFLVAGRTAGLGAALVRAMRTAATRREQRAHEAQLRESERRLRDLSGHLQSLIESERSAIAREIHDEIGGTLTALRYDLSWIARNGEPGSAQRAAQALESVAVAELAGQRLVRDLRPPVLDAGIMAALDWLLAQFRKRTGAKTTLRVNTDRFELTDDVAMTIYRTLQEALTNIVKHAGATRVDVDVVVREDMLSLEVLDDGRGIAQADADKAGSFGIRGLKERANSVGGWLELSAARKGTALLLTVPAVRNEMPVAQHSATP